MNSYVVSVAIFLNMTLPLGKGDSQSLFCQLSPEQLFSTDKTTVILGALFPSTQLWRKGRVFWVVIVLRMIYQ